MPRRRPEASRTSRGDDPLPFLVQSFQIAAGRPLATAEEVRLRRYLDLMAEWNRTQRLTGLRSRSEMARVLVADSFLVLPLLPAGAIALADIGSGVGVPGVPLKIVRDEISLVLIESRRKPVSFLAHTMRELEIAGVEILHTRAEQAIIERPELSERFDVVVSRGVGGLPELVALGMRYLRPGGRFVSPGPPATAKLPPNPVPGIAEWRRLRSPGHPDGRLFLVADKGIGSLKAGPPD